VGRWHIALKSRFEERGLKIWRRLDDDAPVSGDWIIGTVYNHLIHGQNGPFSGLQTEMAARSN
jgi:hypothetical protein